MTHDVSLGSFVYPEHLSVSAGPGAIGYPATEETVTDMSEESNDKREAAGALGELTRLLGEKGFAARIVEATAEPPFVRATSRVSPELSENVTCGPGEGGELWFFYSWGDPLAPVRQVDAAAERVSHVLTPQGAMGGGAAGARAGAR